MSKKFILIAEDDEFYANVYRAKISEGGHEVIVTSNGEEVLKLANQRQPDLMILDLMMPVKDGFETLQHLRAHHTLKNIPVVVISYLNQPEDIQRIRNLGINDYICKSDLMFNQLVTIVEKHG